jgi:hypothetical protein
VKAWILFLFILALLASGVSAATAKPLQHEALRLGDHGPRVKDIQWLLSGHKPSVYRNSIHPYGGKITGRYDLRTQRAVRAAKYQLGYPMRSVDGRAGHQLSQFLLGRRARPLSWIGVVSTRRHSAIAGQTACSRREVTLAVSQLGAHEVPWHSNRGPRVHVYQHVTGAYGLPWCASFVQWVLLNSGVGTIANRSAGVFYIVNWAHQHTMLHSVPKPGALVAYLSQLGHIGVVEKVTKTGFFTIEGNSGDAVRRRFHPTGYAHTVFIWLKC